VYNGVYIHYFTGDKMADNEHFYLKTGDKYYNLTVDKYSHKDKRWRKWYHFKCDCGTERLLMGSAVTSGNTKSCGCYAKIARQKQRLPNNLGVIRQIILGYKRHARDRNIEYNLSEEDVINIISKNCYYCDLPPSNIKKTKNHTGYSYSGIDRIDSSKHYTKDNCVACCDKCNKSKLAYTTEDFLSWVERVYNHSIRDK
jgi:hypothetical protein